MVPLQLQFYESNKTIKNNNTQLFINEYSLLEDLVVLRRTGDEILEESMMFQHSCTPTVSPLLMKGFQFGFELLNLPKKPLIKDVQQSI